MKIKYVLFSACLLFVSFSSQAADDEFEPSIPLEFLKAINIPTPVPSLKLVEPDTTSHNIFFNQTDTHSVVQALNIRFFEDVIFGESIIQEAVLDSVILQQTSSSNSFQAINYVGRRLSI